MIPILWLILIAILAAGGGFLAGLLFNPEYFDYGVGVSTESDKK